MNIYFDSRSFIYNDKNCIAKDEILKEVEAKLDKQRFEHVKSVALLCYKIAVSNKLDNPLRYYFAGLVHDIAKNMDKNSEVIDKYLNEYEKSFPKYCLHQFLAPYIIKEIFSLNDKEILDAVKYHCSGKPNMSIMAKIVYASDKIDPLRGYDSKDMIDAMMKDYESGFIYVLKENKKFIESKSKQDNFNILSDECFKFYLG